MKKKIIGLFAILVTVPSIILAEAGLSGVATKLNSTLGTVYTLILSAIGIAFA
jgi:hypothetical protein